MKAQIFFLAVIFLGVPELLTAQHDPTQAKIVSDTLNNSYADSTEYELIVFDNDFNNWLITNSRPVNFYENQYYRTKNHLNSVTWNNLVKQYLHQPPYEYEIDYQPEIDYGIEVNWKLYWYFRYLEGTLGVKLN